MTLTVLKAVYILLPMTVDSRLGWARDSGADEPPPATGAACVHWHHPLHSSLTCTLPLGLHTITTHPVYGHTPSTHPLPATSTALRPPALLSPATASPSKTHAHRLGERVHLQEQRWDLRPTIGEKQFLNVLTKKSHSMRCVSMNLACL